MYINEKPVLHVVDRGTTFWNSHIFRGAVLWERTECIGAMLVDHIRWIPYVNVELSRQRIRVYRLQRKLCGTRYSTDTYGNRVTQLVRLGEAFPCNPEAYLQESII
jgi:hypothetical protein